MVLHCKVADFFLFYGFCADYHSPRRRISMIAYRSSSLIKQCSNRRYLIPSIGSFGEKTYPTSWAGSSVKFRCFKSTSTTLSMSDDNNGIHHHPHPTYAKVDLASIRGKFGAYKEEYNKSIQDPESFWGEAAKNIDWFEPPKTVLQQDSVHPEIFHWFPDGKLNMSYNCLDRHVLAGRGNQVALYYDSPVTGVKERYTYSQLLDQVSQFASVLQDDLGVLTGDRVVIYMPMIPQAVIAMLACCRIGAIHSVVFGGFASPELASRISDCRPKVIISASTGVEPSRVVPYKPLLDQALKLTPHEVQNTIIVQRHNVQTCDLGPKDLDYDTLMAHASGRKADAVAVPSTHPHYVLYTSGTTGLPKGVVRETGGGAVALKYSMDRFYGMDPGDVFWSGSDIGWVVGHSYIVYAPLLHGCTTILYEGKPVGTPDAGAFWRVLSEYQSKALFVAPTAFRAMRQVDPDAHLAKQYDLSKLETIFLAGEHSDPETLHWIERAVPHVPAPVDHWWQTELGWPGVGNAIGLGRMPIHYGACAMPVPGYEITIVDDDGKKVEPNTLGNMTIKIPLPPGTLQTIYNHNERYIKDYLTKYPGYYDTGDAAYMDEDGFVYIMGRTDDIINTAGHRLSTGAMEEILMEHPIVADCAVIPVKDEIKGQIPVGLVVCSVDTTEDEYDKIRAELVQLVREAMGPVASFKLVGIVKKLPKTRSGKTLRGIMSKIANGQVYKVPPTVEDPTIFEYLESEIRKLVAKP